MTRVIKMRAGTPAGGSDIVMTEVIRITPSMAAQWLKANNINRPLQRSHVSFLARELKAGHWQLNGQAIVIAEDESVLDGQHRLHAIIEAGQPMTTLVVYGITPEAFKTMDTGKVRSGRDVLSLNFPDAPLVITGAVATAARWSMLFNEKTVSSAAKQSNTDILAFVHANPELWRLCEMLNGFPKDGRLMALGPCTALYHHFAMRDYDAAELFMMRFSTGAGLEVTSAEYILRQMLAKDAARTTAKLPLKVRVVMVIKAWNIVRRGVKPTRQGISLHHRDDSWIDIL